MNKHKAKITMLQNKINQIEPHNACNMYKIKCINKHTYEVTKFHKQVKKEMKRKKKP
jgi:hypothetical protein